MFVVILAILLVATKPGLLSKTPLLSFVSSQVKQINRHLCTLKISRRLGLQDGLPQDEKLALVDELIKRSEAALEYGKELLNTDLQYGDEYLLMAVHLLIDVWEARGRD